MSNYILLSLCILFLIKTSLRLIKAEILAYWASYLLFLIIPFIPREKAREREKENRKGVGSEGEGRRGEHRHRHHLLYPNQIFFSRFFLSSPYPYWPSHYFTKLSPYVSYLAPGRKLSRWKNYLLHFYQPRESFMFLTWITASCSICHILDLSHAQCNIYQWSFKIFY